MPALHIITGSNGAGKSSVGPEYIPVALREHVFDGDKLFMQKRSEFWTGGVKSHKECKKLAAAYVDQTFDELVENALAREEDFAYEGHFTNDATWTIPQRFKTSGYQIYLTFLGLENTVLSESRVIDRTRREGGHYVDPITIASNFFGNLEKLDVYFEMFDSVTILDTSKLDHVTLAILHHGTAVSFTSSELLPPWFTTNLPVITSRIKNAGYGSYKNC